MLTSRSALALLLGVILVFVAIAAFLPKIPQPLSYHDFADRRPFLGIPNFGDVASNLPFAIFGLMGVVFLLGTRSRSSFVDSRERWPYLIFFVGVFLTAFGSGYYHWAPSNTTLLWDRLPMTIAFMAIVAAIIAERVSIPLGLGLLAPLVLIGASSAFQWYFSELRGAGDLRFYATIQAFPLVVVPVLIFATRPRYTRTFDLAWVVAFYLFAKVLEYFDKTIFSFGHAVSGHTLKHLSASLSAYFLLRMLRLRHPLDSSSR